MIRTGEIPRRYVWAALGLGLAGFWFTGWSELESAGDWQIDLEVYQNGWDAWWNGGELYGPMPPTRSGNPLPFNYPAFALIGLLPFAALPWSAAATLLVLTNFFVIAAVLYAFARAAWPAGGARGALILAAIGFPLAFLLEPVGSTFGFGQINLLMMGLVALDCLAPKSRWPRGIGVGIAAAIKLTPAAFVLFFLLRRDYRAAITAAITGAVAVVISFLMEFEGSLAYWTFSTDGQADASGSPFRTNQALEGAIARFGLGDTATVLLWILFSLVVLAITVVAMRRSEPAVALLANATAALLISPTSWSHHWVWIAPALLVMAVMAVKRAWERSPVDVGWAIGFVLAATIFQLALFEELPGYNDRELNWTAGQQLEGNSYLLLALAFLICLAAPALKIFRREPALDEVASR